VPTSAPVGRCRDRGRLLAASRNARYKPHDVPSVRHGLPACLGGSCTRFGSQQPLRPEQSDLPKLMSRERFYSTTRSNLGFAFLNHLFVTRDQPGDY
jgi:hypothetical protein